MCSLCVGGMPCRDLFKKFPFMFFNSLFNLIGFVTSTQIERNFDENCSCSHFSRGRFGFLEDDAGGPDVLVNEDVLAQGVKISGGNVRLLLEGVSYKAGGPRSAKLAMLAPPMPEVRIHSSSIGAHDANYLLSFDKQCCLFSCGLSAEIPQLCVCSLRCRESLQKRLSQAA